MHHEECKCGEAISAVKTIISIKKRPPRSERYCHNIVFKTESNKITIVKLLVLHIGDIALSNCRSIRSYLTLYEGFLLVFLKQINIC